MPTQTSTAGVPPRTSAWATFCFSLVKTGVERQGAALTSGADRLTTQDPCGYTLHFVGEEGRSAVAVEPRLAVIDLPTSVA